MRCYSILGVAIVILAAPAAGGNACDGDPFVAWQQVQENFESLIVDFGMETKDIVFADKRQSEGTLRLLKTRDGKVHGSYDILHKNRDGSAGERLDGLLADGSIYLLLHERKSAVRFVPRDGDARGFLAKYLSPFVILLDRKRAEESHTLEVECDQWYTYLQMKAKQPGSGGWFLPLRQGRVAILKEANAAIPKNMPAQLWHTDGTSEVTVTINSWRLNDKNGPTLKEFLKPEDRPGWTVVDDPSVWPAVK